MDRRQFLTARRTKPAVQREFPNARTLSGVEEYTGPWTKNEVQHLLKRTMFGSTAADLAHFTSLSLDSSINELLSPVAAVPAPPVNDYSMEMADPNVPAGATWINDLTLNEDLNEVRRASFKQWWTGAMINQDRSIREKLTLFWADHWGTETRTIGISHFVYRHNELLRKDCLGNFRTMVKDVTVDAGMLIYLNGFLNSASAPDENYARELMELFTLGKGPSVQYNEDDVRRAARVLTGWRINNTTGDVYFDTAKHDSNNKTFSSYFNNTVVTGQAGTNGELETDALISMLFAKDEVSLYICRCLYRWFVYYRIDDAAEANVIEPMAQLFRESDYEIKPVLDLLLRSEHFFDVLNQGCLIKSPVDNLVGCMREFGVVFPSATTEYNECYAMWKWIRNWQANMGQNVGDPPDVSGWPAYYQEPSFHELWINHDTLPKRNMFTDNMIWNGHTINGRKIMIDTIAFTKTLSNPGNPNALVEDALSILYRVPISTASKLSIKQGILLSGQTQDYYWTNAWNGYLADPSNMTAETIIANRLKSFYQYLMNLSEYQRS